MATLDLNKVYPAIVGLWEQLCDAHTHLYDLTCEEYECLLASEMDTLDKITEKKLITLEYISELESIRKKIISDLGGRPLSTFGELRILLGQINEERDYNHLEKFNTLLVKIIENIQNQNKKNQIFINKALINLRNIRESMMGTKTFSTYNSNGQSFNRSVGR